MGSKSVWWICLALALGVASDAWATLPNGWSSLDIGTTGGSADEAEGTWTVRGDGADIWSTADAFHFVYTRLAGDCEITARVVDNGVGSNTWAKGGVMIRETLGAGSKNAMMAITGGDGGGMAFQNRPSTNGRPYSAHSSLTAAPPHWVRLKREGDTITAYSSSDGVDWVQQPDGIAADSTVNPVDIPMAAEVCVGLAVTSHAEGEVRTYTFDNVTIGRPVSAGEPEPADGAVHPETWAVLSWVPDATASSHDVYFGESFADVRDGMGETFQGNQALSYFTVGLADSAYPEGLVPGTTYYWRVDEVGADDVTRHRGSVWRFVVVSGQAYDPFPPDGSAFASTSILLTWASGLGAEQHTVHFGEDFDAVANSEGGKALAGAEYRCRDLEAGTTYYWRVDEFDGQTTHRGEVWQFRTVPADLASATFYYVDKGHPDARDGNPGSESEPWQTIRKGVQSVQPGDILLVRAGTYRETVILNRSGTEAQPITIRAYPGEEGKVVINAAEPVTDWRPCASAAECGGNPYWAHVYVADVSAWVDSHPDSTFAIRQVFQDGALLNRSRYPNVGWRYPTTIPDAKRRFVDNSLSQADGYFVGSVCHVKTALWQMDMIPVTEFVRGEVTLARSPRYDISAQHGYYLTNVVGEINEEGEWAYDPGGKRLYLWPQGDVPQGVEFTYREYCVLTYGGTSWNVVRGLAMHNAYRHGIWLYQANHMTIEDNVVEHAYEHGIYLQATNGQCANNRILNNTVRYSASRGIGVDGTASHNRVAGNYVYATGVEQYGGDLMNGQSFGVYISGPFTEVYNNRIDRTGYSALYLDGEILGREISHNYITNVSLALSDAGGVYTAGYRSGPEKDHIHRNIIEDAIGCLSMYQGYDVGLPVTIARYAGDTSGIYVDEQGNNRLIEHNTVIGSHKAGIFFHWAPGNVVQKNTLYGNKVAQVRLSGRNQPQEILVDDVLLDNIMFATEAPQRTLYLSMNYDNVRFGQSDRNYFYNPYADRHIHVSRYVDAGNGATRVVREDMTLAEWRAMSGYDGNSREISYLDQLPDITITQPRTSRIVYNASLAPASLDLGGETYCDVDGNRIDGTVTLQPFESKVLIASD